MISREFKRPTDEVQSVTETPENQELTTQSDSRDLENALREVQHKINGLKEVEDGDSNQELVDLKDREAELIKIISRRAKDMMKEEPYAAFAKQIEMKISQEFDQVTESIPKDQQNEESIRQALIGLMGYLKPRVETFVKESKLSDEVNLEAVFEKMDASIDSDKSQFMAKMNEALQSIVIAHDKNPQVAQTMERAQRKEFARSSIDGVKFEVIPDTDDIISIGVGLNDIHLHLAPMRTLSDVEKYKFAKKIMPNALRHIALEKVKNNENIKEISGTSYIVAAMPELFRQYGFTISTMEPEYQVQYWGDEKRPILKASISREDFLRKYAAPVTPTS